MIRRIIVGISIFIIFLFPISLFILFVWPILNIPDDFAVKFLIPKYPNALNWWSTAGSGLPFADNPSGDIHFQTSDDSKQVIDYYKDKMVSRNWSITDEYDSTYQGSKQASQAKPKAWQVDPAALASPEITRTIIFRRQIFGHTFNVNVGSSDFEDKRPNIVFIRVTHEKVYLRW